MKLLAGELPALAGTRTEARDLGSAISRSISSSSWRSRQSPFEQLQALRRVSRGGGRRARASRNCATFSPASVSAVTGCSSRSRRSPAARRRGWCWRCVAYRRPNLLLLDEPTNHLDLEMRQALAVALQDYEGAVVLVSHDRHLLRTVADEFLLVADGRASPFDGDLDDYARWLAEHAPGSAAASQPAPVPAPSVAPPAAAKPSESAEMRKDRKRTEAQRRAALGPLRARIAKFEQQIEALGEEAAKLERELLQATAANDAARITLLSQQRGRVAGSLAAAETGWIQASEELERGSAN